MVEQDTVNIKEKVRFFLGTIGRIIYTLNSDVSQLEAEFTRPLV